MNKTTRIFALFIALSTLISPAHAIEIQTWKYLTGLGALSGAIIGAAIYRKHFNSQKNQNPLQDDLVEQEKAIIKEDYLAIGATIGSACIGAAVTALAVAAWFYQFRPDARFAKAQGLIASAERDDYVNAFINDGIDGRSIEQRAHTYFRRYPLVYAEQSMYRAIGKLLSAEELCRLATQDAIGNAILIGYCDQARLQANNLIGIARELRRDISMHPNYAIQVAQEGAEQIAQRHAAAAERTARAAEIRALTPRVTVVHNAANTGALYGINGIRINQ